MGARDFSSAVSGFCDPRVFLAASAYGGRCVGLRPTPKTREKPLVPREGKLIQTSTVI